MTEIKRTRSSLWRINTKREYQQREASIACVEMVPDLPRRRTIWSEVAAREGVKFEVLDVADTLGRSVAVDLGIRTVPAMVIDGKLRALGTCTISQASALLQQGAKPG